eukprot:2601460-Rhodomonas_salina.1
MPRVRCSERGAGRLCAAPWAQRLACARRSSRAPSGPRPRRSCGASRCASRFRESGSGPAGARGSARRGRSRPRSGCTCADPRATFSA